MDEVEPAFVLLIFGCFGSGIGLEDVLVKVKVGSLNYTNMDKIFSNSVLVVLW